MALDVLHKARFVVPWDGPTIFFMKKFKSFHIHWKKNLKEIVTNTKTTKSIGFLNQDENKGGPSAKYRSWNKKTRQEHDMCETLIQQDLIARKKQKQSRLW